MRITTKLFLMPVFFVAGCAQHQTATQRPNDPHDRVVYTGSHIPQPRDQVTASPLSANTPSESVSRHPDSLVPTEPVVGATDNTGGQGDTGPTPAPR